MIDFRRLDWGSLNDFRGLDKGVQNNLRGLDQGVRNDCRSSIRRFKMTKGARFGGCWGSAWNINLTVFYHNRLTLAFSLDEHIFECENTYSRANKLGLLLKYFVSLSSISKIRLFSYISEVFSKIIFKL